MTFFRSNGLNFYYEVTGKGAPILLLNGLGCDTRTMEPLAECLKGSFTVINYDMRCAGRSDKPDVPFTVTQVADEIHLLIEHLRYKKVSILGFSMGGMVGMELFRCYKNLIDNLILVSPTPSFKRPHPLPEKLISMLRCTDVSNILLKQVYESMFGDGFRKIHSLDEYIRLRMKDTNPQPVHAYLRQLAACEGFDAFDDVRKIDIPTTIIGGDEDKLIPHANLEWLHKNIAGSELHILNGIGHMAPLEAPEEISKIILSSLLPV